VQQRLAGALFRPGVTVPDDAVLVVSELVTNSMRAGARRCSVELQLSADAVELVVFDDAPGDPRLGAPDESSDHGRGLPIVDALCERWRVRRTEVGKQVEVRLSVPAGAGLRLPTSSALFRNNVTVGGRPDGRPMLFAHGFGCDQDAWRPVLRKFESDHQVVAFDHVGFGRSDRSAWDPDRHA
jgi:hypothetical protein